MLNTHLKAILIFLFTSISVSSYATHLIGGHMGYEYIGQIGANYRYKIILTTYTNCGPTSAIPLPEGPTLPIGVYEHDVQNDPTGGGNKPILFTSNVTLVDSNIIEPPQASNCSIGASTCIYKGVYEGFIDLPLSFNGYHVFYERCCRNGSIVNLDPSLSMSFDAYIPPALVQNTSPVFTDDPVPFLCAGDTTTILNSAYDPDGDLMVFSFVVPYNGFANSGTPAPAPPSPSLPWTIPTVTYAPGFSFTQPFGTGGYNSINGSTGLTTYFPPVSGDYVVAIEIKEYRNGNLIGITRRDLQLLVLNCPNNPAPNIDPNLGSINTQFSVEEGETLCFDFGYNDPNGDSISLVASGQIFDNSIVSPAATINSPVSDLDTVSTQFCWTTGCGQSQTLPYQFQVSVTDNGCPPKTTNNVFQITVDPVPPPSSIIGDSIICQYSTTTYTTQNISNTTYNWSVTGGNIITNNGNSVDIQWTSPGTGNISLSAVNQFGCTSAPITEDVTVTIAPAVDAGNDTTICFGDTVQLTGTTTATPGFTSTWAGSSIQSPSNLTTNVFPIDTTTYFLTVDIGGGCLGLDSVKVNVNVPFVDADNDTTICIGDSVQLNAQASIGSYLWTPSSTLSNDTILTPNAGPSASTEYFITLTDDAGCTYSDSMTVNIDPGFTLSVSNDTTICQNDCANLVASGATLYAWTPSSTLNDTTLSNPQACPSSTTTYTVIGNTGSCYDTAQVTVNVNPAIVVDAGADVSICENDTIQLSATGATNYTWTPTTNISNPSINNPLVWPTTSTMYYVTGSDGLNCSGIDSILVTVNPLPVADAGPDTWICPGDNDQLNASGGGTYSWSPSTGLSDPNIADPIASPTDTTTYELTVTSIDGCINYDTLTVFVSPTVPTDAGTDTTICPGDTITLGGAPTAVNGTAYLWTPAGLVDNPNAPNPSAFPSVTTMFYVSTSNDTCNGIDSVLITVLTPPSVNAGVDVQICIGDTTQLNATGASNYAWYQSSFLSDTSISDPFAFPLDTTNFIVVGTDINGCSNQDTVSVIVNPLPLANAGIDNSICEGDSTQLNASGGDTYNWTPITNLSDPLINNPYASPLTTTSYIVSVTDSNGCVQNDTVQITVNTLPVVSAGNDTSMCVNDTIQLNASGADTYAWSPNSFINDSTLASPNVFPNSTLDYIVEGTDINGCINTDTITITVNSLPTVSVGTDIQICIGDSAQLNATGADSYLWSPNISLTADNIADPIAFPTDTTMYVVTGTDLNNCSNLDTIIVTVNPLPLINAGLDTSICINDSTQLMATGTGTISWSPSNNLSDPLIFNPWASPIATTNYIATLVDSNSCSNTDTVVVTINNLPTINAGNDTSMCFGDTIQLNATGGSTYAWTPNSFINDSSIANPFIFPPNTMDYIVGSLDANNCFSTDTISITVNALPLVNAGNDVQICIGDSIQMNASGADAYLWTPNSALSANTISNPFAFPSDTTTYVVEGTDAKSCSNTDTVVVIVNPLPNANAGLDQDICLGGTANLSATGGNSYSWTPISTLNNASIASPTASPDTTTSYIVAVTDSNSCIQNDTVIVNVFRISTNPDSSICIGDSMQLNVFGSSGLTYDWTPGTGLSDSTASNPLAGPTNDITYTVTVTNIIGCVDQDSVSVTVNSKPLSSFDSEINAGCDGAVVTFTNTSQNYTQTTWIFGDGETSNETDVEHTFPYGSNFTTSLITINQEGCADTATFDGNTLTFEDYFSITIPNVFTPNNDGVNDHFKIELAGKLYECIDMQIFNRWGQVMFISTGNNTTWEGRTMEGTPVPEGTYFYTISIQNKVYKGTLNILR